MNMYILTILLSRRKSVTLKCERILAPKKKKKMKTETFNIKKKTSWCPTRLGAWYSSSLCLFHSLSEVIPSHVCFYTTDTLMTLNSCPVFPQTLMFLRRCLVPTDVHSACLMGSREPKFQQDVKILWPPWKALDGVQNFGVALDNQLSFSALIANLSHARFPFKSGGS